MKRRWIPAIASAPLLLVGCTVSERVDEPARDDRIGEGPEAGLRQLGLRASEGNKEAWAELERMVGRLTMELEIAKKASLLLTSRRDGSGR